MDMMNILNYKILNEDPSIIDTIPDGVSIIGAPSFWNKGNYGKGIKIAIIDTGCDVNHKDIKNRIIGAYNFTNEGTVKDVTDYVGHGTHVAGIIGASGGNGGIIGVAPSCELLILKALGKKGGMYSWIVQAINYAVRQKVDIISMSLGGKYDSKELHMAIINAVKNNILVVAAAGNDGDGNFETTEINYPASYNECISVGSISNDIDISRFSASNNELDLLAPGQGKGGKGIISLAPGDKYVELIGTSMATPHVSGALALLKNYAVTEFARGMTEEELYAQLIKRTKTLGFKKSAEGNGMLDLRIGS